MHSLLKRQISRHLGDPDALPPEWQPFLAAVDEAYRQWQGDLSQVERSLELMSVELTDRNRALREQLGERTAAEEALRQSEARLARAHQVARIGNWDWDIHSGVVTWSREVYSLFGVNPATFVPGRKSILARVHPDDRRAAAQAFARTVGSGVPYNVDHRIVLPDGSVRFINEQGELEYDEQGVATRMFGTAHDITSRKRVEAALQQEKAEQAILIRRLEEAHNQLLQSEKLASIGQLAAGVAHEINNPIGYVHSNLGTLEGYVNDLLRIIAACEAARDAIQSEAPECLALDDLMNKLDLPYLKGDIPALMSESREGISRVRKIVQDLKDFSRLDSSPDWQPADLRQGLDSTLNIVQNEIKYRADVVKEYGDIPEIECLPSQLNQVFMNLMVNAAHAIEGPRGTITLRCGRADADDEVWVEVADTGKGIPADNLGRIFDPFFTTKPVGKGTGLGLSLAYGIIQKHNGRIDVASEVGRGSIFRVTLPVRHVETAAQGGGGA